MNALNSLTAMSVIWSVRVVAMPDGQEFAAAVTCRLNDLADLS
jgi:hypothetical protein